MKPSQHSRRRTGRNHAPRHVTTRPGQAKGRRYTPLVVAGSLATSAVVAGYTAFVPSEASSASTPNSTSSSDPTNSATPTEPVAPEAVATAHLSDTSDSTSTTAPAMAPLGEQSESQIATASETLADPETSSRATDSVPTPVAGSQAPAVNNEYADTIEAAGNPTGAASIRALASHQTTRWLTGRSVDNSDLAQMLTGGVKDAGARAGDQMPSVALYNIPHRDCGNYSSGGAADGGAYRAWIDDVSRTIGDSKVAVILEPDALHVTSCLSEDQQQERWDLLNYATKTLKQNNPNAVTYIATSTTWEDEAEMVKRLTASGIANTRGFALNVSGFQTTATNISYGDALASALGGNYHYVIDTSRNGSGPYAGTGEAAWCNPPGRTVGERPTTDTGQQNVDAYLWVKDQTTDGACVNSNPVANPAEYTLQLAQDSGY